MAFSAEKRRQFLLLVLASAVTVNCSVHCSNTEAWQSDENQAPIGYEERVALARTLMEPVRTEVEKNPDSKLRKYYFTRHYVQIDPVWTANFILGHPVPKDGVIYDNDALRHLMSHPQELTDEQILKLLDAQHHTVITSYISLLVENLSKDRTVLRAQLRDKVRTTEVARELGVPEFLSKRKLAHQLDDDELKRKMDQELVEFYTSGEAKKYLDQIVGNPKADKAYTAMLRDIVCRNAPESMQGDFGEPNQRPIWSILHDDSLTDQEKLEELRALKGIEVVQTPFEYMQMASALGAISTLDVGLAESWVEKIADEAGQIWARMQIATSIAKTDQAKAREILKDAYQQLEVISRTEAPDRDYNYPPALIGALGLRLVAEVDASLLEEDIEKVVAASKSLLASRLADSQANYFEVITAIARFDRDTAKSMFDAEAPSFELHASAAYFAALAALYPERILEEFEKLPKDPDERGITWQPYVYNALIPALCAKTDNDYWNALAKLSSLTIAADVIKGQVRLQLRGR